MARLIAYRLALALPQLAAVSLVVFLLTYLIPGSPAAAILGTQANPESIAQLEAQLGLDQSPLVRLGEWFSGAVAGDLGTSIRSALPVTDLLLTRLPATLSLALGGMVVATVAGIGLGVLAGVRPGGPRDRVITAGTSVGLAVPEFWFGLILSLIFAVQLGWVPVIGYTPLTDDPAAWLRGLILPSIALGIGAAALIARQTRGAMAEALASRYVDTLTAAGVPRRRIIGYAFKNAMVPVLATMGITFRILFATSLVVEVVFAFPGIGNLLLTSVIGKDFPVVQGGVLIIAALVIAVNLLIDVGYGLLNPRVRPQ
ncbi:ABC transporter permease [Actinoplanes sp. NBC_00393]|uniref:ABC transporter permease n=1 Tax=Actinoplanes sp. NBC_00393 TaxID=2975953 RepID=UPI002E1BB2FC